MMATKQIDIDDQTTMIAWRLRLVAVLIVLLGGYLLIEVFSFAVYWLVSGKAFSFTQVFAEQQLISRAVPYVVTGPRKSYADDSAIVEDLADIWQHSSLQLHWLCKGNNIKYFHFLQPNQYVADSKKLTARELKQAYSKNHPYKRGFDLGYPLLCEKANGLVENGVSFRNLSMIFADVTEEIYVDSCCHFNMLGNEIMAKEIARTILANP
jgi:hypothetical protein